MSSFLRLGVTCAVFDDTGQVLLSKRGDLGLWNLPGGRVDGGELLADAAVREVREETGVEIEIERPVGLYYSAGWQRLNVLYRARTVGGQLAGRTHESLDNAFFAPDELPEGTLRAFKIFDALDGDTHLQHIETPPDELRAMKRRFARRWLENLLRGRPEPRYHRFNIHAALALWDEGRQRVMTVPVEHERRILRMRCDGKAAPWSQIQTLVQDECDWTGLPLRWRGVVENPALNLIVFVFESGISAAALCPALQWIYVADPLLSAPDRQYLRQMLDEELVWTIRFRDGGE